MIIAREDYIIVTSYSLSVPTGVPHIEVEFQVA